MTTKTRKEYFIVIAGLVLSDFASAYSFLAQPNRRHSRCASFPPVAFRQECRIISRVPRSLISLSESKAGSSSVAADDIDSIQELFNKYCDKDGLMTKAALAAMPPFCDMLVGYTTTLFACMTVPVRVDQGRISKHSSRITPRQM